MNEVGGAKSPVLHFLESGPCSFLEPADTSWYSWCVGRGVILRLTMASLWNLNYHYVMSSGGERSTYLYSKMCCAGECRGGVSSAGLWCFQCGYKSSLSGG